jgi:hypothetical protein
MDSYLLEASDLSPKFKDFLEKLLTGQVTDEDYDEIAEDFNDVDPDVLLMESLDEFEYLQPEDKSVEVHYLGAGKAWVLPKKNHFKN